MGTTDPWAFDWTQLLTIIGFAITMVIAFGGFRTFGRWKREKLEEQKIEIAFDVLTVTYEAKYIFGQIRSIMAFGYEWEDMPEEPGETKEQRNSRGPFYATLKRIQANKDYFERVWKLQPRCMAVFGPSAEEIFLLLHRARREVEVSAQVLARRSFESRNRGQYERDVWDMGSFEPEKDRVGMRISEFRDRAEALCRPIINQQFGPVSSRRRKRQR
jgi:hypothetical protein